MRTPSQAVALSALGASDGELGQVLALLHAAGVDEPASMSVAAGDRRLLELHRALSGQDVEVAARCADCGTVSSATLVPSNLPDAVERSAPLGPGGGLRQPTYGDLRGLPADELEAEAELLRRCVVGAPTRPADPSALEAVDDALTGPIVFACVDCGASLAVAADAQQLVLAGLQRLAAELELEIHLIAQAYGWSLETIEALPDDRRRRLAGYVADGR